MYLVYKLTEYINYSMNQKSKLFLVNRTGGSIIHTSIVIVEDLYAFRNDIGCVMHILALSI